MIMTIKLIRRRPYQPNSCSSRWRVTYNQTKNKLYPMPVCTRNAHSLGESYECNICSRCMHAKCRGLLNSAQHRRNNDWICDPCSSSPNQQSSVPPPTIFSHPGHTPSKAPLENTHGGLTTTVGLVPKYIRSIDSYFIQQPQRLRSREGIQQKQYPQGLGKCILSTTLQMT